MKKFYLTTAIAYVNGKPHIGHALEFIQADVLARFYRLNGVDAYFLTGTDEHGVKIVETAKEKGVSTEALVEENAAVFKSLEGILNLSNDDFIRTTEDRHKKGATKMWKKIVENGDIYKDVYQGNYCIGCEAFIPEKDLDENGECPHHKKKPEVLEEENYFFKLSKYSDAIKEAIEKDEFKIVPTSRKKEMLNLIGEEGLKDVSFSRPKEVLPWGIEVPDDDSQVMYVWGDALSNYITALDYENEGALYKKFWPCDAHIIGKDILRFHAGIWPGMLLAAGEKLPKALYVHGFITSEGQKMGKSLGNVVDPLEYAEKYGSDALRYFLMREIPTTDDGDFSHGRFLEVFNSELANGLGNLVNRVVMMTGKYFDGKAPAKTDGGELVADLEAILDQYKAAVEAFDLKKGVEALVSAVDYANKYIDDKKPWAMAKEADPALGEVMYNLIEALRFVANLAYPYVPVAAERIAKQLGFEAKDLSLDFKWGKTKEGQSIEVGEALFPRLEESA